MLDVALSRPWLAGRNSNVVISTHFFASVPKHQNSAGSHSVARKRKRDRWQQRAKQQQYKMNSGRTVLPLAIFKGRNDSGLLLTMQWSSLTCAVLRLTGLDAGIYTGDSRWARSFGLACLESFRVPLSGVFRTSEFSKFANFSGRR